MHAGKECKVVRSSTLPVDPVICLANMSKPQKRTQEMRTVTQIAHSVTRVTWGSKCREKWAELTEQGRQ